MNKNTQIILGVCTLALVGYLVWKNNQSDKKNADGFSCPRGSKQNVVKDQDGKKYWQCIDKRGVQHIYDGSGKQLW